MFQETGAEGHMPISVHTLTSYIYDCITNSPLMKDLLKLSVYD